MTTRRLKPLRAVVAASLLLALASRGLAKEEIHFNRDVRPILSENCFRCHGPDKAARKAKLRLDQRDSALEVGAIVPFDPEASAMVERIFSDNPRHVMPPTRTGKTLSEADKGTLRRWIADGAVYEPHWAFVPVPAKVEVPAVGDPLGFVTSPIDAFVLERLAARGLRPAPPASREAWLRRATLDLTGLPPTLAEIDAFLADRSDLAFEHAADRLLASSAYGERMAQDWLDVARYADTFGYQADRDMHVWPWRDWLIRAFNDDLSYDRFLLWQIAGDLLPDATRDQRLATAFNRLHRQTNEGGSIEEEFRIAYVADRVRTAGTAFLGLTIECARCHDHKYDPIAQRDFYSLSAFFDNIDEHGLYSHFTETAPTPAMLLYEGDQEERHAELRAAIAAAEARVTNAREAARARFEQHAEETARITWLPAALARFDFEAATARGDCHPAPGVGSGQGLEFGGDDAYPCEGVKTLPRTAELSVALWVKPGELGPRQVVLHRSVAAEDAAFRGFALTLDRGHAVVSLVHFWPGNALRVATEAVLPAGRWTHVVVSYDGSSKAAGVHVYLDGRDAPLAVVRDCLTRDTTYHVESDGMVEPPFQLGARYRDIGFRGGAVDELAIYDRTLTAIEARLAAGLPGEGDDRERFEHYLARLDAGYRDAVAQLAALRTREDDLLSQVRQVMVMQEDPGRRATHVLRRGAYDAPAEEVLPDTPASILPFPDGLPRNRLGLARWMIDARNPLPSRVAVNRLWQIFFGKGLVATTEDFGTQGQPPSHPELLDWLARRFMDSGWDVKALCRTIVLSSTYRQSSSPADPRTFALDPENRLLAHGPRHRLSGEQIRDQALAASGLLELRIGGPSVRPYQPDGLWEEAGTGKVYVPSTGADLYRRSLYTFWRRTSPPPTMTTFDATSREVCTARREQTATPLQALVLLDDPQLVEAARVLAERLIEAHGSALEARIAEAFRRFTGRWPAADETRVLQRLWVEQRAHFDGDVDAALALTAIGALPRRPSLDPCDVAATTVLVQAIMSFDECVTPR